MSVIHGRYNMQADIYEQTTSRDPDTGQTVRTWSFLKTVRCQARGVISEGIRTLGSTEGYTKAQMAYEEEDWVKLKLAEPLSKRHVVTNIRNLKSNDPIWFDFETDKPTVFDVKGSQPTPDPFGIPVEYEITLYRRQDGEVEQIL